MISYVRVQGFESHADTEIDFSSRVTVILGLSDAGKSSLFRAINWALFNRHRGDSFIRQGESEARVTVKLREGQTITRYKSKSVNSYQLDDQEFRAFGSDVPESIADTINMDRNLNVQAQIDPLYLVQASPGEVARHWNDIADLDAIDRALSNLQSWERAAKQDLKREQERVQSLETRLAEYKGLDGLEAVLQEAESLEARITDLTHRRSQTYNRVEEVKRAQQKVEAAKRTADWAQDAQEAQRLADQVKEKQGARARLTKAKQKYEQAQERVRALKQQAEWDEEMSAALAIPEKIHSKERERTQIARALSATTQARGKAQSARERLSQAESEWHEKAPAVCPLCEGAGTLIEKEEV